MLFEWDENKSNSNELKHGISFETASLVFEDPYLYTRPDNRFIYHEQRWQSIGLAEHILLSVIHTAEDHENEEIIRIISARKAGSDQARRYYFNR